MNFMVNFSHVSSTSGDFPLVFPMEKPRKNLAPSHGPGFGARRLPAAAARRRRNLTEPLLGKDPQKRSRIK